MAEITAALVKDLRTKTGAGMMDCKKALVENDGDVEAAVDWLRTKGLAAAAKKAGRVAAEGLIAVQTEGTSGAMVELNAETDFVSRNAQFQDLARTMAGIAFDVGDDLAAISAAPFPGMGRTAGEELTNAIATIGENMNLRRAVRLQAGQGAVTAYVHNAAAENVGKIGVLVALESAADASALQNLGKQLAMHIAATNPLSLSVDDLNSDDIERERSVLVEQARESGKPDDIIEKMVEGRLRKFYQEVVLLEQTYVIDGETKVAKAIEAAAKDAGSPIAVTGFARFALGEGIEREESDFAAEVAATAAG